METEQPIITIKRTTEIDKALRYIKKYFPNLSDADILKLGLSKLYSEILDEADSKNEIRKISSYSVGEDYLRDKDEDIYKLKNNL